MNETVVINTIRKLVMVHMQSITPALQGFRVDNLPFTNASGVGGNNTAEGVGIRSRITVLLGDTQHAEITGDGGTFRANGVCFVEFYGPVEKGDNKLLELAQGVTNAFRNKTIETVRFETARVKPIGASGAEYQVNSELPFTSDFFGA